MKYNVWKADKNCDPIPGTDKILEGPSERWILDHIAYENGIKRSHNSLIVRLSNGDSWCASKIG